MHRIAKVKDKLLDYAVELCNGDMKQVDGQELMSVVDMVKDLSEAEKSCMEADYYESVVDAMDDGGRYGYPSYGSSGRSNVGRGGRSTRSGYPDDMMMDDDDDRMGYANQYGRNWPANPRNRRRRMRRRGYSEESVENLRQMMEDADPERKKQLKKDLQDLMDEM